jgi:hypothetical protein
VVGELLGKRPLEHRFGHLLEQPTLTKQLDALLTGLLDQRLSLLGTQELRPLRLSSRSPHLDSVCYFRGVIHDVTPLANRSCGPGWRSRPYTADLTRPTKIPDLAQALEGHFNADHAQLAKSILDRLDRVDQSLAELDQAITAACEPWAHQIELLVTIPGVGPRVAQTIVAETGADMSQFPSAAHLASWAGLAPSMHESAGKRTPAGRRRGNKWLTAMLVEAAGSVGRMHGKNYLAVQHARLT